MNTITPRELYDAGIAAGLKMSGLTQRTDDIVARVAVHTDHYFDYENPRGGEVVKRRTVYPEASLADVEAAIIDALVEREDPMFPFPHRAKDGLLKWIVRTAYEVYGLEEGFYRDQLDESISHPHDNRPHPTRAHALKAACEAIAKEK